MGNGQSAEERDRDGAVYRDWLDDLMVCDGGQVRFDHIPRSHRLVSAGEAAPGVGPPHPSCGQPPVRRRTGAARCGAAGREAADQRSNSRSALRVGALGAAAVMAMASAAALTAPAAGGDSRKGLPRTVLASLSLAANNGRLALGNTAPFRPDTQVGAKRRKS